MSVKSGIVQHTSITFCDPDARVVFGNQQISSEVITASGFGRDRDTIFVIWRRHVPFVVVFFVEFVWTLKFAHRVLEIVFHQPYSRKICTFHFGDRHPGFMADVDVMRYRKWHY